MAEIRRKKNTSSKQNYHIRDYTEKNRYKKNINKIPQMDNDCG